MCGQRHPRLAAFEFDGALRHRHTIGCVAAAFANHETIPAADLVQVTTCAQGKALVTPYRRRGSVESHGVVAMTAASKCPVQVTAESRCIPNAGSIR